LFSYETFEASPELQPIFLFCIKEPYIYDYYSDLFNSSDYTIRKWHNQSPERHIWLTHCILAQEAHCTVFPLKIYGSWDEDKAYSTQENYVYNSRKVGY
jgi:hypothetical protein